jgi:hypothetical protein
MYVFTCVCVFAHARACVCVCLCVCARVRVSRARKSLCATFPLEGLLLAHNFGFCILFSLFIACPHGHRVCVGSPTPFRLMCWRATFQGSFEGPFPADLSPFWRECSFGSFWREGSFGSFWRECSFGSFWTKGTSGGSLEASCQTCGAGSRWASIILGPAPAMYTFDERHMLRTCKGLHLLRDTYSHAQAHRNQGRTLLYEGECR